MKRLRPKLTFTNVVACLALFVALGSGAVAASQLGKNTVGTKQLKKNAVTTAKIKNEAVTAAKVKKGTLTGAQINAATLGTVPIASRAGHADTAGDSNTLQGIGPNAFVHGNGSVIVGRRDLDAPSLEVLLIDLPGIGRIETECEAGPTSVFRVFNTSGDIVDVSELHKGAQAVFTIPNGGSLAKAATVGEVWQFQIATRAAAPTVANLEVTQSFAGPKTCEIFAQATMGS